MTVTPPVGSDRYTTNDFRNNKSGRHGLCKQAGKQQRYRPQSKILIHLMASVHLYIYILLFIVASRFYNPIGSRMLLWQCRYRLSIYPTAWLFKYLGYPKLMGNRMNHFATDACHCQAVSSNCDMCGESETPATVQILIPWYFLCIGYCNTQLTKL